MSNPIIEIQGVGKRYRIGATKEPYLSLRDEVAKWFSPAARRTRAAENPRKICLQLCQHLCYALRDLVIVHGDCPDFCSPRAAWLRKWDCPL
jgi:hypothetical protein